MREMNDHEIKCVGGEGFWGAVEGALGGGALGAGAVGAAVFWGLP